MPLELLPLFPLSVVLFPRTQLPLHIFEERYKDMIGEAIQEKSEFGVVLATDQGVANTGCTAIVANVTQRHADGRLDILSVGVRRFEILDLDSEKMYLRGTVDYFNDEETEQPPVEIRERAISGYRELQAAQEGEPAPDPKWQDPQLSFQLAQPIGDLSLRQQLLTMRSEAERMRLLAEFFPKHLDQRRYVNHVREIAPRNGRGPGIPSD